MAALNYNLVILGGRLTQDPELKTTASGISVCSFAVAVNRPGNKDGERKADFINCTAWRQTAEFITRYFRKASSILVVGSLQQRNWETQDGQKRTTYEVQVNEAHFVDSKNENPLAVQQAAGGYQAAAPTPSYVPDAYRVSPESAPKFDEIGDSDELPF